MKHRRAVGASGRARAIRPPIKGRFSKHAEQLRDWLGEYLIAKYEQALQVYSMNKVRRCDTFTSVLTDSALDACRVCQV